MNLSEAASLASLNAAGQQSFHKERTKTGQQLAAEIWAEARSRNIRGRLGHCKTVEQWQKRYLPSKIFHFVRMPLNAAALTCTPRDPNLVIKKIHAMEETPIVVDYNSSQMGKAMHGFTPPVAVIDGKHRYAAAALRGESHIMAWVGETAIEMIPSLQAVGGGGGGGGPAPERTTGAPGSSLVSSGNVKVGVRGIDSELGHFGGHHPHGGSFGHKQGHFNTRTPEHHKTMRLGSCCKACDDKKMAAEGAHLDKLNVKKCYAEFQAACKSGYKPRMSAVSPPGWSGTVEHMKEDHPEIDNPFALSWWMKDKGYSPHHAPTK